MIKINRKIDNMAESKSMTRDEFEDWSKREQFRSEINNAELLTIQAYQIDQAIIKIQDTNYSKGTKLRKEFYWIESYREDFDKIDKLFKHLTDVCSYIEKKYGTKYQYEWLLTFDDDFYFKANEKKGNSRLKL